MLKKILTQPLYLLLLPVFFVLHGYLENFEFLIAKDIIILCLIYIAFSIGLTFLFYFIFHNKTKAALFTVTCMSIFFFFGAILEFLKKHAPFFSKYSMLLLLIVITLVVVFIYLKKSRKPLHRLPAFLNALFFIYLLFDVTGIIIKIIKPTEHGLLVDEITWESQYRQCDTCKKPDIYLLLMDEYASSLSLKEKYSFHNDIDSFLLQKGFSVQSKSRSNYNLTIFSMASALNMSYIKGIKEPLAITEKDYENGYLLTRNNKVTRLLDSYGYEIINYSIFDFAGYPSKINLPFLSIKTALITDRTLFARFDKDIGWRKIPFFPFNRFKKNYFFKYKNDNQDIKQFIIKNTIEKKSGPRFIYAHLYMPHPPFYYDKSGILKDEETIARESKAIHAPAYLDYVSYTNTQLKDIIAVIQQHNPSAVIILLGDHGFRPKTPGPYPVHYFQNMNAVYYPDKDYRLLYDSITNVNQFRVVFNKLFNRQYTLLKDSSIYLSDKN